MSELVCIACPRGCVIEITEKNGEYEVRGNLCKRGRDFAVAETVNPMRTVSSVVATTFKDAPVVPVRVSAEIPKNRIFDVMKEINKVVVTERIGSGDAVIKNVLGLGADVIATSDLLKEVNIK